jgi:hypothetical protein
MSKIAKKRTQNILDKAKEQIKKAKDKVKNTRPSELAEVDYINYHNFKDFSSDEFQNKPFTAPMVNSTGYGTFMGEPIRVENALNSPDNPNEDIPKWANIQEELPEWETHPVELPEKETHPVEGPEDETLPEEPPEDETLPEEGPEPPNRKEEVKKAQDKGIIQVVVLAVAVAGTVGAYLWGKN